MPKPHIHGPANLCTASNVLKIAGETLKTIKREDRLTFAQMGEVLGKHEDRAAAYAEGASDMGLAGHSMAARQWRERYLNPWLALFGLKAVPLEAVCDSDRKVASSLSATQLKINLALEDNQTIDDDELLDMVTEVEDSGRKLDALRERIRRLRLRSVA